MAITPQALNRTSLAAFPALFAALPPPDCASLPGFYRAEFVGPGWLRAVAPPGLALIHLRGFWGKEIGPDCTGASLVRRSGVVQRRLPIRLNTGLSLLDRKPVVVVRYLPECPFPWPHVVDELRRLDDSRLLGMTIVDVAALRRLPLPFLLHATERPNGL